MTSRTRMVGAAVVAVATIATLVARDLWARSRPERPALDQSALSRDLDLVAGVAIELAPAGGDPLLVASELAPPGERTAARAPRAAARPRRRATPAPAPQPEPEPVEAPAVAEDPQGTEVAEVATAGEGAPASEELGADASAPAEGPGRPTPIPVGYPGTGSVGTSGTGASGAAGSWATSAASSSAAGRCTATTAFRVAPGIARAARAARSATSRGC